MDKVSGMDLGLSDGIQERLAVACAERLPPQRRGEVRNFVIVLTVELGGLLTLLRACERLSAFVSGKACVER